MRVLAVTDRSSLTLALTMMVPDWDVDSVASADAAIATDGYDCIVIEAPTTGAGTRGLAGLRRGGCAAPAVIVGDVGTDDAETAVDGDGHVILTRPFTIADLRDHITAMVDPTHEPDPSPEVPAKAERRFPWRRTDGGTAGPHRPRPVSIPAAEPPDQATYSPPDDLVPRVVGPTTGVAGGGPTGGQPSPEVLEPPGDLPEQQVPDPPTPAPVFSIVMPTDVHRIDPLLLRTAAESGQEAGGEPVVVAMDDLFGSAPAEAPIAGEASGSGPLDPDMEAPADDLAAAPPLRDGALDGDVPVNEESAAEDEPEDEHVWSRMLLAELVNAFDPVTAAVWVRRDGGAWTSAAALGLKPAESQRSVPRDHPLFAGVAEDLHGLLLSPADLARGYLAGIPGTWTEDIMAVGIGSRRGCDAIVVIGGDAYEKRDVRRLVALAAGATPSRSSGRRRIAELFQRH